MKAITPSLAPPQSQAQIEDKSRGAVISTKQAQQQPEPPEPPVPPVPPAPFNTHPSDMSWTIANLLPPKYGVALKTSNRRTYNDIDTTIQSMIQRLITSDIRTINIEVLKDIFIFGTDAQLTKVFDKVIQELISFDLSYTASDQENIASVILRIAMSDAGRTALIANPNVITRLTTLAKQANTELGRNYIAASIRNIENSPEGRRSHFTVS